MYQHHQQEQPSEKSTVQKIHVLAHRYADYGEESSDWLIDTTAGQTVPERYRVIHDTLVAVRIHKETMTVMGSCLYYVHANVSGRRRRSCSDNTAVSCSMKMRQTLSII